MREAARERFSSPFMFYLWHPEGTSFSDEDYGKRDIDLLPPDDQECLIGLKVHEEEKPED